MKISPSFLTVILAPLAGVVVYVSPILLAYPFDLGLLGIVLLIWFLALLIVAMIGLPIGFGVARLLQRLSMENLLSFVVCGTVIAAALPLSVGWFELVFGCAVTGALLGAGYWQFEVRPYRDNA
ncbi:hypothetical protein GRI58_06445 [Porphyrobacter algicida]|uniref:Uncharacterized protein n=1 Tax=Qipengyuania algicida TaxID=1836209 RepID=A0A845AHR7_9SPHN|nr:hypothetical protein [Qipengyuania algicida]MXP28461.1 hypothetical protein [Qipengyuania algicida]